MHVCLCYYKRFTQTILKYTKSDFPFRVNQPKKLTYNIYYQAMGKSHTKRSSTVINSNYLEQWVNQCKSLGKFTGQTGKYMPLYGNDSTLLNDLPETLHLFLWWFCDSMIFREMLYFHIVILHQVFWWGGLRVQLSAFSCWNSISTGILVL